METEGPLISLWGVDIGRFIWFCASGQSFFIGVGLLLAAVFLPTRHWKKWATSAVYICGIFGLCLIVLSVPAISWLVIIPWMICILVFFILSAMRSQRTDKPLKVSRLILGSRCLIAMIAETPFHIRKAMPQSKHERLYVVGDSVSAGIGRQDELTWPVIMAQEHGVDVTNLAMAGATVNSAIKQAKQIESLNAIVLLEIGGNDLFAPTPFDEFERDLRTILEIVQKEGRVVVMLELPLLPHLIGYGQIQRRLAKEYNIVFVPKRFLVGVFGTRGATMDMAHLTPEGHELMAEKVWRLLGDNLVHSN